MVRRAVLKVMALIAFLSVLVAPAFGETGVLEGDQYTFTDRTGETVTVPVSSFASYVVDFQHGDPWRDADTNTDPQIAIGLPDANDSSGSTGDLCLGKGGVLILGFDEAIYDGPGNDVYIFEVGGYVEETLVELSDDLVTWYEIGIAEGRTAGLDIAGKVPDGSGFRYVRLTDTGANPDGSAPGADIDTVCGLNTRALPEEPEDFEPALPSDTEDDASSSEGRLNLVGTWQGFYLGVTDGVDIMRRICVGITECEGGSFAGTLYFETPTNPEATGEYRIEGTVDDEGNVHYQGTGEWVIYCDSFAQSPFDGTLCTCGDTINGVVGDNPDRGFFIEKVDDAVPEPTGTNEDGGAEGAIDDYPVMLTNFNTDAVQNGAPYSPVFVPEEDMTIVSITTYHWNNGDGALPGEITLVDYRPDGEGEGTIVGTWPAVPRDGYLGAQNVYWDAFCEVNLEAGRMYVVYDSDWGTWSYNTESNDEGFAELRGYLASDVS